MSREENKVTLRIFDFTCLPSEITSVIRLEPTRTGIKGEPCDPPNARIARRWDSNYWAHEIGIDRTAPIDTHISELSRLLTTREAELRSIMGHSEAEIGIVMYCTTWNPGVHIDREVLRQLGSLGIELDVDIYCVDEEQ